MKITIQGLDYTAALDAVRPLTIERKLNEPSICQLWLSLPFNGTLTTPLRNQYLTVAGDDGTVYFTGYIAVSPLLEYAGLALEGPRYRIALQALSDELILDQMLLPPGSIGTNQSAAVLLTGLVTRVGATALSTLGMTLAATVNNFVPELGAAWSSSAGAVASQARAAYRAVNGALTLAAVPGAVHTLNETDGSLTLANLGFTASVKRALANDATVCGEHEPVAYATEYFLGDGLTTEFDLSADPFALTAAKSTLIHELFNGAQIDQQVWSAVGGEGYLFLGPGGLTMNGGNGIDGDVLISWIETIEVGGTLLLEATGVSLSLGSTGILAGLYVGIVKQAACVAGFQVTAQTGTGTVSIQPIVSGNPVGTICTLSASTQYALRVRLHCCENQRALSIYRSFGDSGPITCGGQTNTLPGLVQMEIQPFVDGVAGMPVTLFDGAVASLPVTCVIVPASSTNLFGSMRGVNLSNLGSGWVVCTPSGGTAYTRRLGTLAESAECHLNRTGKLAFYAGFAPPAGEQIAVSYRTIGRAVGRAVNTASQQALALAGLPSVAAWIGSVTDPAARSSADCRNAALAIEEAASGVSALWAGSYKGVRNSFASDVWPGDALQLVVPSANLNAQVVVRTVKVSYSASQPDLVEYAITFANDWADDLAIKTSTTVPADTWLPAPIAPTFLANLNALTVTALSGSTVTINAGATPPTGGGFEVRRRDFAFQAGVDSDLVLRATTPTFTIARETATDRFYIRMFDGSTPPNYSEFSTALFINLPVGS
jgi:hypothetical protein